MPIEKKDFLKWLRKLSFGDGDEELRSIELHHEGDNDMVDRWFPKPNFNVESLAKEMKDVCEDDARQRSEFQRYKFSPFFGSDGDTTTRRPFSTWYNFPVIDDAGDAGSNEGPNIKGITAQQMRLLNDVFKTSVGSQGVVLRTMAEFVDDLKGMLVQRDTRITQLEDENRVLRTKDFHEKLVLRKEAFWESQKEKLVDAFTPLIPTGFNAIVGSLLGPAATSKMLAEANTPIENEMQALFGSMDSDQFHGMMKNFKPQQQAIAWRIGLHFKQKWDADQARIRNRGGGNAPPTAPAGAEGDGRKPPPTTGGPQNTTGGGSAGTGGGSGGTTGDKKPS